MAALAGGSMRVNGSARRWRLPRRLRWRRRAIAHSLVLTLVAVGAGISCGRAHAQQSPPEVQTLERIEITGSLIKRIEGETALPIVTITAEELARAGITNAEEAVRLITQNQGGFPTSLSTSQFVGAAAYANLRSLGAQRTLVLLNGRRVVRNPSGAVSVDLNTLPLAAVQRIEALTDGASATYGSDAIAGVINFITRREYQGVTVSGEVQIPEEPGSEIYTASLVAGWGNLEKQRWNVYGSLNYRKQEPLGGTERDFAARAYVPERGFNGTSPVTFPGNYSQSVDPDGSGPAPPRVAVPNTNPSLPACFPPSSIRVLTDPNRCFADTQPFTWTHPKQEQWQVFSRGSFAISDSATLFAEYFYARNGIVTQIAPSPEQGLTLTPASPYYPGNGITPITHPGLVTTAPVTVGWRTTALGPRVSEWQNDTQRAVAGIEGSASGWDYQGALLWSKSRVTQDLVSGQPNLFAVRSGVAGTGGAPFLNPFGDQTPEGLAYLRANVLTGTLAQDESELQSVSGVLSRRFGELPGGPMSVAVGLEYREEQTTSSTDLAKSALAGSFTIAPNALLEFQRDLSAVALEMAFPVARGLEFGAAVRYDRYSDFGSTTNPKVTLRYTPVQELLLRASYNSGFAAPTLFDLFSTQHVMPTGLRANDPLLCPGGNPVPGAVPSRDCDAPVQRLAGGNPTLLPEESTAYTVGFVIQPVPSFTFSVDFFKYEVTDTIDTIGLGNIFNDPAQYPALFIRCSQVPAAQRVTFASCLSPGPVDPLAYVIDTQQNLGNIEVKGLDFQANWQGPVTSMGRFSVGLRGTYISSYDFQLLKDGPYQNAVGAPPGTFPTVIRLQTVTTLGWERNEWSANLLWRFQSGYVDENRNIPPSSPFFNRLHDYSVFDLSATWRALRGLTVRAGVLNVLDRDPPFSNQLILFQYRGYDGFFHNPRGRTYTLSASYQFP